MSRKLVSSGSLYEGSIGFSRAVRIGNTIAVSGTAPIAAVKELLSPEWLVEMEADCLIEE